MKLIRFIVATGFLLSLSACQTIKTPVQSGEDPVKQAGLKNIPALQKTVMPPSSKMTPVYFDLSVNHSDSKTFFENLSKMSHSNIVVDPAIQGDISIQVNHVTLIELLSLLEDRYNYAFEKTSYGYYIFPNKTITRIYHINYLDMIRQGKSETVVGPGQLTNSNSGNNQNININQPASDINTKTDNEFWQELSKTLNQIINQNATNANSISINASAGLVTVSTLPKQQEMIKTYLNQLQQNMNREVIIEAKILEVQLNNNLQTGINWQLLGMSQQGNTALTPQLKPFASFFTLQASGPAQFSAIIDLLSTQGKVSVLSSPRIATMNNQKSLIKFGSDQFFVTNVESNTNNNGSSNTVSQNVELTPFFSGIALDVTPEIDNNNDVTLHIHPMISDVQEQQKKFIVSGQTQDLPLASSTIRESDNVVRVKNQQIIVIGGLTENHVTNNQASIPVLGKIPLIGWIFQRNSQQHEQLELVILLQPTVVQDTTWVDVLEKTNERFEGLD